MSLSCKVAFHKALGEDQSTPALKGFGVWEDMVGFMRERDPRLERVRAYNLNSDELEWDTSRNGPTTSEPCFVVFQQKDECDAFTRQFQEEVENVEVHEGECWNPESYRVSFSKEEGSFTPSLKKSMIWDDMVTFMRHRDRLLDRVSAYNVNSHKLGWDTSPSASPDSEPCSVEFQRKDECVEFVFEFVEYIKKVRKISDDNRTDDETSSEGVETE